MIRQGAGSGKLILFGEHAAVYGFPAIGVPLPFQTSLCWTAAESTPIEQKNIGSKKPNSTVKTPDEVGEDRRVFVKLLKKLKSEVRDLDNLESGVWRRISGVPRTGGFGSSAALCVAISRIALNKPMEGYDVQVHSLASRLETLFHGKTSGIDTGMACDNGASAWFKSPRGAPERKAICIPKWHITYGAIPRTQSTADSILQLEHRKTLLSMRELGKTATNFLRVIAPGSPPENFANSASKLVNHAQEILASLCLSNPTLDKIFELARKCGASGGKLSGGGSGGAFFICAPSRKIRDEILRILPCYLAEEGINLSFPLSPLDFSNHLAGSINPKPVPVNCKSSV